MMRLLFVCAGLLLAPLRVEAAHWGPFTDSEFAAAQKAGHVVLLQFTGSGCEACAEQERVLWRLLPDSPRKDLDGFQVDFDRCGELCRRYSVTGLSTLLMFRGTAEIGRSVGLNTESEINAAIQKALAHEIRGRPRPRLRIHTPPRP